MNTHDKIELPPLPFVGGLSTPFYEKAMHEWCYAAIEADRQRRGGPVVWQVRTRPEWREEWSAWKECTLEAAEDYRRTPLLHDWHFEVRELFTEPQLAEPSIKKKINDEWGQKLASLNHAEPVKCETCRDSGIIGHSDVCPCCKDTWEPADSVVRNVRTTAEPVKVPSDEELADIADEVTRQWQDRQRMPPMSWDFRGFLVSGMRALLTRYGARP